MLLNLVDKHWTRQKSLHHHNNFLCALEFGTEEYHIWLQATVIKDVFIISISPAQAVHILSIMEKDISTQESEVKTLRGKVDTLNFRASTQTEEHRVEVCNLSAQLQEARSEVVSGFGNSKAHLYQYSLD